MRGIKTVAPLCALAMQKRGEKGYGIVSQHKPTHVNIARQDLQHGEIMLNPEHDGLRERRHIGHRVLDAVGQGLFAVGHLGLVVVVHALLQVDTGFRLLTGRRFIDDIDGIFGRHGVGMGSVGSTQERGKQTTSSPWLWADCEGLVPKIFFLLGVEILIGRVASLDVKGSCERRRMAMHLEVLCHVLTYGDGSAEVHFVYIHSSLYIVFWS